LPGDLGLPVLEIVSGTYIIATWVDALAADRSVAYRGDEFVRRPDHRLHYGLVVVRLARRELVWINVTSHPTAEWLAANH
jgi:hypothetical protein